MKKTIFLMGILTMLLAVNIFAQMTLPRASPRAERFADRR